MGPRSSASKNSSTFCTSAHAPDHAHSCQLRFTNRCLTVSSRMLIYSWALSLLGGPAQAQGTFATSPHAWLRHMHGNMVTAMINRKTTSALGNIWDCQAGAALNASPDFRVKSPTS